MITRISSAGNEKIKFIKSLSQRKNRIKYRQYIAEGMRTVKDALIYADVALIAATESCARELSFDSSENDIYIVPEFIFEKISDTCSPQGVLAVINMSDSSPPMIKDGAYVYCDNIRDPGNLGTIIRTADGAGFDGVLLSPGCADCRSSKVIRACMGSFFRMNIYEDVNPEALSEYTVYAGILSDTAQDYRTADYNGGIVIAVGNEANGISEQTKEICCGIKIPIYGRAESLNAAVAAALMMYEAANKRRI